MFKLQRPNNRQSKPGECLDFRFSNFQALQVPKGWDRLFVSLISVESGKTIAKLGKTLVRNGSCQWMETLSESIWISWDDSSKEYTESLLKIVVSMGSTRSSTLGEATINMAHYTSSKISSAISQPLKKCSHGTVLQVEILCLASIAKTSDGDSNYSNPQEKDLNHNLGSQSNESENSSDGAARPSQGQTTTPPHLKSNSKVTSQSVGQSHSFDAIEGSIGRENLSTRSSSKSQIYHSNERDAGDIFYDSPIPDKYSVEDESPLQGNSFNSRLSLGEDLQNVIAFNRPSMTNFGSSRNLLEAAEDTIQELRAEAKMWERNARKLMVDLEVSRKEFTDLSKKHADSVMELFAAHTEHDSLKREVDQLRLELQQLTTKQATLEDQSIQSKLLIQIQKELDNEIKYQCNMNANLDQQLRHTQESNLELVSVLQELEETIEQQRMEIDNLSSLKLDFTDLEDSIARNSDDNKILLLQLRQLQESEKALHSEVQLLEVALRDKSYKVEKERNSHSQFLFHVKKDYMCKLSAKEEEIARLEAKLSSQVGVEHEEALHDNGESTMERTREIESLREKIVELEKDCAELADENLELLFKLKDSNKTEIREFASFDSLSSEHPAISRSDESEVSDPNFHISNLEEELKNKEKEELQNAESYEQYVEILEQLKMASDLLMKPWFDMSNASDKHNDILDEFMNSSNGKELSAKDFLSFFLDLNKLLEARVTECEEIHRHHEIEIKEKNAVISNAEKRIEDCLLEIQEHEKERTKIEGYYADIVKELDRKTSEVDIIKADLLSKEEQTQFLLQHQRELEVEVFELQRDNCHLEERWELEVRERNAVSESLENLQNDFKVLCDTVDSHVSAKTILERRLEELENKRHESEIILSGLQDEKIQLQECISSLEARVSYLNGEKGFLQQERDNSRSVAMSLQHEIQKLKFKTVNQLLNLKQQADETEIQWLQAVVECEYHKAENQNLQSSAASLIEDGMKLQSSNSELKEKNQELRENCSDLVAQLSKSNDNLSDCEKKVELLENRLTSVVEEFAFLQSNLKSQLDVLVEENNTQKEKLYLQEGLHCTILENATEFATLQKEVDNLTRQIAGPHEEREIISFEAAGEVSSLLADRASLQEVLSKAELTKNQLASVQLDSNMEVQELRDQLASLQVDHDILMADHEQTLKLLANYKKSEERLKTDINDVELKLTISDYECQQLTKEMGVLKVQLQNISGLEDDIATLKREIKQCRLDKGKLELALQTVSGDYEELNKENFSLSEKTSSLQDTMSEFEECKSKKSALEEKLLQMENELAGNEILHAQIAGLKNELSEVKRANSQFQQTIYRLEKEREEWLKKAQSLEEDLKLMGETFETYKKVAYDHNFHEEIPVSVVDHAGKKHLLEKEVAQEWDADNKDRTQQKGRFSAGQNSNAFSRKSDDGGRVVAREKYERTKSSLVTELRDLRDRYLEMSLKYAEVEAQREDLVMKLKATGSGRRWFS